MNINDLTHEQLNTLAAMGQGWEKELVDHFLYWFDREANQYMIPVQAYYPCDDWSQAGALMDAIVASANLEINRGVWIINGFCTYAPDLKLAIVRAFVASKYGTEIDYEKIVGGEG